MVRACSHSAPPRKIDAPEGSYWNMEETRQGEGPSLSVYENVRCLECGSVYTKPTRGGTARANPGCPECGYVGWVATNVPVTTMSEQSRSVEDQRLGRSAQSR